MKKLTILLLCLLLGGFVWPGAPFLHNVTASAAGLKVSRACLETPDSYLFQQNHCRC